MVGVSHHDLPLTVLERLSRNVGSLPFDLVNLPHAGVSGAVLLSTCNRVELYLDADDPRRAALTVRELLAKRAEEQEELLPLPAFGQEVARHLFSVAAGLESMVIGEDEVSGQVRRSIAEAREAHTTSPALERLFQMASATSKEVSTNSGLGAAGRSIISVALDLVEQEFGPIEGRSALLVGTGAFARVSHAALAKRGVRSPHIYSSSGRAHRFIESHEGVAVEAGELIDVVRSVDLVISCSGAPHPVLDAHTLAVATADRPHSLPVLDLALTQDVADDARTLSNVAVIDLEFISRHAPKEHGDSLQAARKLVHEAVARHSAKESERSADAAIVRFRGHVQAVIEHELDRVRGRLSAEEFAHVAESLNRMAGELLHTPTMRARQFSREGAAEEFEAALQTVFGIEVRD